MMDGAMLMALLAFNAEVARDLTRLEHPPRVFVGAQLNDDPAAISWTKCVPESGVMVVQLSERARGASLGVLRHAAAHEVCHAMIHAKVPCAADYGALPTVRQREMEREAEECATDMLGRGQ